MQGLCSSGLFFLVQRVETRLPTPTAAPLEDPGPVPSLDLPITAACTDSAVQQFLPQWLVILRQQHKQRQQCRKCRAAMPSSVVGHSEPTAQPAPTVPQVVYSDSFLSG
eukprot:scaffold39712_cov18-Tisochrysis_lutea.AAC.2